MYSCKSCAEVQTPLSSEARPTRSPVLTYRITCIRQAFAKNGEKRHASSCKPPADSSSSEEEPVEVKVEVRSPGPNPLPDVRYRRAV
eukprot:1530233-Rhodomonas_salina.3